MSLWKTTACLFVATVLIAGCDSKSEDKTAPAASSTPPAAPSMMDKTMDKMHEAGTAAADKATEMKDSAVSNATDAKNATADKMTDMKNSAVSNVTDAKATLVATAQKYYDEAKQMLDSKNITGASDIVTKLEGLKAQLPAEWAAKIDDLSSMVSKAKASLGNMVPTTMPKFN